MATEVVDVAISRAHVEGAKAVLDELAANGVRTIAEARVLIEALHTDSLKRISQNTEIPYTSVSRIAFGLSALELLEYRDVKDDRRCKTVHARVVLT